MQFDSHEFVNTILVVLAAHASITTGFWRTKGWYTIMLSALSLSGITLFIALVVLRASGMTCFDLWASARSVAYLAFFAALWEDLNPEEKLKYRLAAYFILGSIVVTGVMRQVDIHGFLFAIWNPQANTIVDYIERVGPYLLPRLPLFLFLASRLPAALRSRRFEMAVLSAYGMFELAGDLFKMVIMDYFQLELFQFRYDLWWRTFLAVGAFAAIVSHALLSKSGGIVLVPRQDNDTFAILNEHSRQLAVLNDGLRSSREMMGILVWNQVIVNRDYLGPEELRLYLGLENQEQVEAFLQLHSIHPITLTNSGKWVVPKSLISRKLQVNE